MKRTYMTPCGRILAVEAADCLRTSLNYEDENDGISLPRVEWSLSTVREKEGR